MVIFQFGYIKAIWILHKFYLYEKQNANGNNKLITYINWYKKVIYICGFKAGNNQVSEDF